MDSYPAGASYYRSFTTLDPDTGSNLDADATPTATARTNGADDASFLLTVTKVATGLYEITGTVPVGYSNGDRVEVRVTASVTGSVNASVVTNTAPVDRFVVDVLASAAVLASDGLDQVDVTEPTGAMSGYNFRQLLRWLVMRFANASKTTSTLTVKTAAGATSTTQAVSDDGSGNESTGVPS